MEPAHHFVPLRLKECFRTNVNVGKEGYTDTLFCRCLVMVRFEWEMKIVHIKDIPSLAKSTGDAQHVVWHQSRFDDGFLGTVPVVTFTLGKQACHLPGFVFKAPDQVSVFCVAGFVDQPNGDRLVFVSLVPGGLGDQSCNFLMLARELRIFHNQFPDLLQSVGKTRRDVRHFSFRDGVACDVKMDGNIGRSIARMHGKIRMVPVG